jgi:peptide/nickel transport system permease protein
MPGSKLIRWQAFFHRIGWLERAGIVAMLAITLLALLAPWLAPYDPQLRVAGSYLPPSAAHWFGTDEIGRDLLSRVMLGVRYTWLPGLAVILLSLAVGTAIGLVSGAAGGKVDWLIQRTVDLFLVVPATLSALAVIAALGPGLVNTMIAVTVSWWPWYARICRDEVRRLAVRPHVEAARVAGAHGPRLVLKYILPGVTPSLIVAATLDVANIVMALSLMSFLGLGQPAPTPELGAMTARSLDSLTAFWWLPILPAAMIFVLCLAANVTGDGLRAALRGR